LSRSGGHNQWFVAEQTQAAINSQVARSDIDPAFPVLRTLVGAPRQ
jgi:hypothetical protein